MIEMHFIYPCVFVYTVNNNNNIKFPLLNIFVSVRWVEHNRGGARPENPPRWGERVHSRYSIKRFKKKYLLDPELTRKTQPQKSARIHMKKPHKI